MDAIDGRTDGSLVSAGEAEATRFRGLSRDWDNPARMPERFSIMLMLAVLSIVSVAFCILRLLNTPPATVFFFTLLFTLIALAQMLFPRAPRLVSSVTGSVYCVLWFTVAFVLEQEALFPRSSALEKLVYVAGLLCAGWILIIPFGALVGYLGGGLVAGAFLLLGWRES